MFEDFFDNDDFLIDPEELENTDDTEMWNTGNEPDLFATGEQQDIFSTL